MNPETEKQFSNVNNPVDQPGISSPPVATQIGSNMPINSVNSPKLGGFMNKLSPQQKKLFRIFGIVGGIIFALLVVSIIATALRGIKRPAPAPTASPTAAPTFAPITTTPSKYATDSAVIKINDDVNSLDTDLNNVNYRDPNLTPPNVRFDKNFAIK